MRNGSIIGSSAIRIITPVLAGSPRGTSTIDTIESAAMPGAPAVAMAANIDSISVQKHFACG